ncbi:putative permease, DMT superfamily [Burkholderiales bacterium JOSHI_001]|nr:putative permease, DMT superfamily [Burkholderiales bacterium JOSHI_001]
MRSEAQPLAPWWAYLSLAASMALVGSYVGLSRLLVAVFPVFLLAWLRFGIAAVAMGHWLKRAPGEPALGPTERRLLFWESFLGNFLFSICMLFGVQLTSAVSAGVVMAAIPAAVALLSHFFLDERVGQRVAVAIALAMAGIALLGWQKPPSTAGTAGTAQQWLGHALLLGAVLCEASYVVIGKKLSASLSPRRISALINLWGLALVTPLGLWQAWTFDFSAVPRPTWVLLVFYALAASMATVWLWMKGLQWVPAPQAGVFTVMLPVSAAAVGALFLGESFGAWHALAMALALAGLLLATWPQRA